MIPITAKDTLIYSRFPGAWMCRHLDARKALIMLGVAIGQRLDKARSWPCFSDVLPVTYFR